MSFNGKSYVIKVAVTVITLLILNILIFFQKPHTDNILRVYFLDVGQGDAILIETPNKTQILIDSGPNNKVITELSEILPFFDRTIDIIIPSHSDLDHIAGFPEILRRFTIRNYLDSGFIDEDELNNEIRLLVQNEDRITTQQINRGEKISLDVPHNISLEILWPTKDYETKENNDRSIVARLDYGETSFLFTGDASSDIEKILLNDFTSSSSSAHILDVDILKAGHHGSKTSSSLEFLEKVSPELTVISAGKDNKFSHPNTEVIDNLNKVSSQIKNTAEVGRILIESDGQTYWVKEENLFNQTSFLQSLVRAILVNSS